MNGIVLRTAALPFTARAELLIQSTPPFTACAGSAFNGCETPIIMGRFFDVS